MSVEDEDSSVATKPKYPPGFRARRGQNWFFVGCMYASFYLCRYNLSLSAKEIKAEFNFSNEDFGWIFTGFFWIYAIGQFCNGLLTDRMGGKKAMLVGACGTIVLNIIFGAASYVGVLGLFIAIRMMDGYMQSFGAPGMIKINAAWFRHDERGRFAGIFGFMIQAGRFAINWLAPALMTGTTVLFLTIPALHWRYVFWVPACITALVSVCLYLFVKDTPDAAGWKGVIRDEHSEEEEGEDVTPPFKEVLYKITSNKYVWIVAGAYFCTGVVRQGIDMWFPLFLQEKHGILKSSSEFQAVAFFIPFVAVIGSLMSGYVSDVFFGGRRAPVAATLYFTETVIILAAAQFTGLYVLCGFLLLISFTVNSTHSILGTAAAMDVGGRKMAGFASGVIDSFQYFGAGLSGFALGRILDQYGWGAWFYSLAGFGILGGCLMLSIVNRKSLRKDSDLEAIAARQAAAAAKDS